MLGPGRDATIEKVRANLAAKGLIFGCGTIQRFFARNAVTRKKDDGCHEQGRPDVLNRRGEWFEGQLDLEPERSSS